MNAATFAAEALKPAVPVDPEKSVKSNDGQPATSGKKKHATKLNSTALGAPPPGTGRSAIGQMQGSSQGRSNQQGGRSGPGGMAAPGRNGGSRPSGIGGVAIPGRSENGGSGHARGVGGFTIPSGSGSDRASGGNNNQGRSNGVGRPGASNNNGTIRHRRGETMEDGGDKPGGFRMGAPQSYSGSALGSVKKTDSGPSVSESRGAGSYERPGYKPDKDKGSGDKGPGDKGPGDKGPGDKGPGDKGPGDKPDKDSSGTPNDNDTGSGGSTKMKGRAGDLDKPGRNENDLGSGGSQKISKDGGTTDGNGNDESGGSKTIGTRLNQGNAPLINPVDQ